MVYFVAQKEKSALFCVPQKTPRTPAKLCDSARENKKISPFLCSPKKSKNKQIADDLNERSNIK
jgi:hypothetical protein